MDFFTIKETAEHLGITKASVYKRIENGTMKPVEVNGKQMFSENQINEYNQFMSVREVGEVLGISRQAVHKAIKAGRIKAVRFGHIYRINKEWFKNYLESGGDKQ